MLDAANDEVLCSRCYSVGVVCILIQEQSVEPSSVLTKLNYGKMWKNVDEHFILKCLELLMRIL